ncbi:carbohydrate ABC transporter permease [Phytohabitans kaempferiae]|uniref:Carbohydrate ABC transporter permease n=1 Tax=Phytohabitans kaempferiae TaxID=1620943 RepID=A0ABV6M4R0_9ACTN
MSLAPPGETRLVTRNRPTSTRRRRRTLRSRNSRLSAVMLLPAVLVALLFIGFPLYMIVNLSLRDGKTMIMSEVNDLPFTTNNYRAVLSNPETWEALRITAIYTLATVAGAFTIGLLSALVLRRRLVGRRWLRTLVLIPWAIPGVVATVTFVWMLDGTYGVFNYLLRKVGLIDQNVAWFFDPETALIGVLMPTIWIAYPLCTLMLLAALQSVPAELYEAARVDGASPRAQFRHVTWPAIQSSAVLAMIVTGLWTFTTFDFIYAITRGGPDRATETLAVAIYNEAFVYFNLPYASTLGVITMAIAVMCLFILFPVVRRRFF